MEIDYQKYFIALEQSSLIKIQGKVSCIRGLIIEAQGPSVPIGNLCYIKTSTNKEIKAEVVGFNEEITQLMPLENMEGIAPGNKVVACSSPLSIYGGNQLLGRILDGLGTPLDGKGVLKREEPIFLNNKAPSPLKRDRIDSVFSTGLKAIDGILTCAKGQRIGIFAGSGVGKSVTLGMMARGSEADINVIALIGERGREVKEFIERDLGKSGLSKSIIICVTSDQEALLRVRGAFLATAIAEYFRDLGKNVLLMMDSLTRFAMAQREIGLAIGEPPTAKGYTPSVFHILPKLLERAGKNDKGTITAYYTVLVEGDDMNDPLADSVRSIIDGHIILSRRLAARNHYPAIEILESISRLFSDIASEKQKKIVKKIKTLMATYQEAEDLINVGAYTKGSNSLIDESIATLPLILDFLKQNTLESFSYTETLTLLQNLIGSFDEKI